MLKEKDMQKEKDMLIPPPPPPSISNLYLTCEAFLLNLCDFLADASIQYTGER